ncbi:MAG: ThiF family adenylyltransferase, partial [Desulfobacterales bacterium]|nr:ThiF family adenylyltransferase [Desulfobacterales bacterium]
MTIPALAIDPVFARNPEEAAVLRERHVLLVGLGSVGSALALMAARTGIGRFTLVDPEALELENVGRHMLSRDSVGVPKVQGVERAIKSVNPAAEVQAYATDLMRLSPADLLQPSPPDLILCGADSFACTSAVNTLSLEANIPAVYVGCWGSARVGEILYVVPGQTPCLECVLGFRRDATPTLADDPRKYTESNFDTTRIPSQAGLWPSILLIST